MRDGPAGQIPQAERIPVVFSVPELWLLHDFVRHEIPDAKSWRYPPASEDLNEEIAMALESCETHELAEYTLMLSRGDLLLIDYFVRRDQKTPEGASGKQVLLKIFRARKTLATEIPDHDGDDLTYTEVSHGRADNDSGKNPL